mmetsp:Transcript_60824/g.132074  ORF Transcript_60824/g.132074 Transcript_60824/m.132074 type:complete len:88 (+) Transcript_60824:1097-1360(+)
MPHTQQHTPSTSGRERRTRTTHHTSHPSQYQRPNLPAIFQHQKSLYPEEEIGVFYCGPKVLAKQLYKCCRDNTAHAGTRFRFFKENF